MSIVTVFMFGIKTQFASTHVDGLINLMGAIAFSLGLILVVLTNSELLTSNFMYFTVGWYYKVVSVKKMTWILLYCFLRKYFRWVLYYFLNEICTCHDTRNDTSFNSFSSEKTVDSTWLNILQKVFSVTSLLILVFLFLCNSKAD